MEVGRSYVYDLIKALRDAGYEVGQDSEGRYYVGDPESEPPSHSAVQNRKAGEKAAITRETTALLSEMEHGLQKKLAATDPAVADESVRRDGAHDLIIHRTDDHFGEVITNQYGDEVFNSDIAEDRVRRVFDESMAKVEQRRDAGIDFDAAHLLLGGDIVTNDAIYEGQKNETDETVKEQVERAANLYIEQIRQLADEFPEVQVACQVGNHGRLGSASINADGIVYSLMDHVIRESDLDNVTFMQSDKTYYLNFDVRDYRFHLRHGHDSSLEHIGTSAGKQRWLSWLVDHGFDAAFRGHYHVYKEEPINGIPVHMGGSIVPQTDFEESHALSGRPVAAIHGATDVAPTEWTEKIYFN